VHYGPACRQAGIKCFCGIISGRFSPLFFSTYLLFAPEGFSLSKEISYPTGAIITLASLVWFLVYANKIRKSVL